MEIRYNVTGAKRKELVKVIADATGARAEYKFMPTCNYEIDYFTVTKDGTLLFDDRADSEEVEQVLEAITAAGFECEAQDGEEQLSEELSEESETEPQEETVGLTVEIPLDKVAVGNLTKLLDAKGSLIKKALGVSKLPIEIQEDRVAFPWFPELPDADAVSEGERKFRAICIIGGKDISETVCTPPCGVCRQVMAEFCDPKKFKVILASGREKYRILRLEELLPFGFGSEYL